MRQKKGLLQEEVVASVAKWQVIRHVKGSPAVIYDCSLKETGEANIFLELIDRLERWREMWLRPFM